MTTIAPAPRKVKSSRAARVFGEGILDTAPRAWSAANPAPPAPVKRDVEAEDRAYVLGFDLARDGVDAAPCGESTAAVKRAFNSGLRDGVRQRGRDLEATHRIEPSMANVEMPCWLAEQYSIA